MNSKYLTLNIKSKDYNGLVIIENDDLCLFFQMTYNKDKKCYKPFVKNYIEKKTALDLGKQNIDKWNFIRVKKNKKVSNNLKKGLDEFIKIYFDENFVERKNINDNERAYIVKILFDNKIACHIDDETGLLLISR